MADYLSQEEIAARVEDIIKVHIGSDDDLPPETHLQDDLDVDSLERVELGVKLEKTFNVTLSKDKVRNSATLKDLINLVVDAKKEKVG